MKSPLLLNPRKPARPCSAEIRPPWPGRPRKCYLNAWPRNKGEPALCHVHTRASYRAPIKLWHGGLFTRKREDR